jgi:hypothetical protein
MDIRLVVAIIVRIRDIIFLVTDFERWINEGGARNPIRLQQLDPAERGCFMLIFA